MRDALWRVGGRFLGFLAGMGGVAAAQAAEPWIERPLTLPTLGFAAEVGLGAGQCTLVAPYPYNTPVGTSKVGVGLHAEAALGLPWDFEVGVSSGYRFAASGALTLADGYARIQDPIPLHLDGGTKALTNPEFRLTHAWPRGDQLLVGLEGRLQPGAAEGSATVFMPGMPVRILLPGLLRIDTGIWTPFVLTATKTWGINVPVALWFQQGDFFFGPVSGLFVNTKVSGPAPDGVPNDLAIHAGLAGGYTLEKQVDFKAQVLTLRLTDPDWVRYIGAGIAVGVRLP